LLAGSHRRQSSTLLGRWDVKHDDILGVIGEHNVEITFVHGLRQRGMRSWITRASSVVYTHGS
jgi:hypothetical protein